MAWTIPRVWIPGEMVTATLLNAHIRDNLNVLATAFVRGGGWSNPAAADAAAVWYVDHAATLTGVKALRKGGTAAAINARRVRPAAAVGAFFQVDGSGGPSYVDETTDANSAAAGDVTVFPATEDTSDYCLIGFASPFRAVRYVIATQGVGSGLSTSWDYWNGSTWAAISGVATLTDGGSAFTAAAGTYETLWSGAGLSGWALTTINGATLYWVRLKITAGSYSTNPILTQAWAIEGGDCLASDLSLTTANEWTDGGAVSNTGFAVGDSLEVVLRSVAGAPTEVAVQCLFTLA